MEVKCKIVRRESDHPYLWKAGDVEEIRLTERPKMCCDPMSAAWEDGAIGFGEYSDMLNKNQNVNIYRCSPYPEGACWEEYAIRFCPFCGQDVRVVVEGSANTPGESA